MTTGLARTPSMYDLRLSKRSQALLDEVVEFMATTIEPASIEFDRLGLDRPDRWQYAPGQLEILDALKAEAKARGLWNFFLPDAGSGEGLSNLDYAYIAFELGGSP